MKHAHALIFSIALVGCNSRPSQEASGRPTPRVTQTVTASPSETPLPSPEVTHYRLLTVIAGHADITFTLVLNGNTVGTLNGDTNGDLTPSILPGDNSVAVSWTTAQPLKESEKATLSIERQIPGQDDWTTVYSRAVDAKTTVKAAKGTFSHEAIGDNSSTNGDADTGGGHTPTDPTENSNATGLNTTALPGRGPAGNPSPITP